MSPDIRSERITRRSFTRNIGNGLVALGAVSAGIACLDTIVNIPKEGDELDPELMSKYPPQTAEQIQTAKQEITVFKATAENCRRSIFARCL